MRRVRISVLQLADLISGVTADINIMCAKLLGSSSIGQENGRLRAFFLRPKIFYFLKENFILKIER